MEGAINQKHIEKMIKKLIIEKEKSGFLPLEPNSEDKQRLTINAKGMVWFTAYGADALR